jgi:hypothetical protein
VGARPDVAVQFKIDGLLPSAAAAQSKQMRSDLGLTTIMVTDGAVSNLKDILRKL